MIKIKLILIFVFAINSAVFGQTQPDKKVQEDQIEWKLLDGDGYKINYPSEWELNESGQMGTSFLLLSPLSNEEDDFRENVNLIKQNLTGYNLDLDQFIELSEGQIKTMVTDGKILSNKRKKNDLGDYQELIYTGKQGVYELKFQQYVYMVENTVYILTFTGKVGEFDQYQKTGEAILNSFETQDSKIAETKPVIEEKNYDVNYPSDWEFSENGPMGTSFLILSPLSNEADDFRENVNLLKQDLTGHNLDFDQFIELSEGQIGTMITDGKLLLSERKRNKVRDYHKIIYVGKVGDRDLKFLQYVYMLENTAYILTLTCKVDEFEKYQKTGIEILDSFKFK